MLRCLAEGTIRDNVLQCREMEISLGEFIEEIVSTVSQRRDSLVLFLLEILLIGLYEKSTESIFITIDTRSSPIGRSRVIVRVSNIEHSSHRAAQLAGRHADDRGLIRTLLSAAASSIRGPAPRMVDLAQSLLFPRPCKHILQRWLVFCSHHAYSQRVVRCCLSRNRGFVMCMARRQCWPKR